VGRRQAQQRKWEQELAEENSERARDEAELRSREEELLQQMHKVILVCVCVCVCVCVRVCVYIYR